MELYDSIRLRTSVRSYDKTKAVSKDVLGYVLKCAQLAPSACNKQPWRILVVQSEEMLAKIQKSYDRDWIKTAPVILAVTAIHSEAWHRSSYDNKDHSDVDASIMIEHICLSATDKGLGTCWVCNFDPKVVSEVLPLQQNEEVIALIPMGYPSDSSVFEKQKIRKELTEFVEYL